MKTLYGKVWIKLDVSLGDVTIDIIQEGSKGFFGFMGGKEAKVRLTVKDGEQDDDILVRILHARRHGGRTPARAQASAPKPKAKPQAPKPEQKAQASKQEAKIQPPKPAAEACRRQAGAGAAQETEAAA